MCEIENDQYVIFFFFSDTCIHCSEMEEKISEFFSNIKMVKINVSEDKEMAYKYSIKEVPAILVFKNRNIISSIVGNCDCIEYLEKVFQL
jgi:thioredoxin-like negative regulator of GroEL